MSNWLGLGLPVPPGAGLCALSWSTGIKPFSKEEEAEGNRGPALSENLRKVEVAQTSPAGNHPRVYLATERCPFLSFVFLHS